MSASTVIESNQSMAIRIHGGVRDGESIELDGASFTVGGDPRCDLVLDHEHGGDCPLHCQIMMGPSGCAVRNWSGKSRLNGDNFQVFALQDGDCISLEQIELEAVITRVDGAAETHAFGSLSASLTDTTVIPPPSQGEVRHSEFTGEPAGPEDTFDVEQVDRLEEPATAGDRDELTEWLAAGEPAGPEDTFDVEQVDRLEEPATAGDRDELTEWLAAGEPAGPEDTFDVEQADRLEEPATAGDRDELTEWLAAGEPAGPEDTFDVEQVDRLEEPTEAIQQSAVQELWRTEEERLLEDESPLEDLKEAAHCNGPETRNISSRRVRRFANDRSRRCLQTIREMQEALVASQECQRRTEEHVAEIESRINDRQAAVDALEFELGQERELRAGLREQLDQSAETLGEHDRDHLRKALIQVAADDGAGDIQEEGDAGLVAKAVARLNELHSHLIRHVESRDELLVGLESIQKQLAERDGQVKQLEADYASIVTQRDSLLQQAVPQVPPRAEEPLSAEPVPVRLSQVGSELTDASTSCDDDSASIQEYMDRLLGNPAVDATAAVDEVAAGTGEVNGDSPAAPRRRRATDTDDLMIALRDPESSDGVRDRIRSSDLAQSDMVAIRELANLAARSAIDQNVRQRWTDAAYGKLTVSLAGVITGVGVSLMGKVWTGVTLWGAATSYVIAAFWGFQAFQLFRLVWVARKRERDRNHAAQDDGDEAPKRPVPLSEIAAQNHSHEVDGDSQRDPDVAPGASHSLGAGDSELPRS